MVKSVKLNESEVADEDDFELGEEYSFSFIQTVQEIYLRRKTCLILQKDKYDFAKVIKTDRDGAHILT